MSAKSKAKNTADLCQTGVKMSLVGKFLISRPTPKDLTYLRTVVYIYEDDENGASGVELTHPTMLRIKDVSSAYSGENYTIYKGGPAVSSALMLLHSTDFTSTNTLHTGAKYDISSDKLMLEKMSNGDLPEYFKFVVGAVIWAPDQLETEIELGAWLVSDLDPEIAFGLEGKQQWEAAIEYVGSEMISRYF